MIQRKQTLFLLAVGIIAVLILFIPFQTGVNDTELIKLNLLSAFTSDITNSNLYVPSILNFTVIAIALITIFKFNNRTLQYKLANILALLNVFIIGLFFLLTFIKEGIAIQTEFSIGVFLPSISIICSFLAAHFIKKDEQLVRSSDRIR